MRILTICLAVALGGCAGELNPVDVREKGVTTEAFHSTKTVREMVVCITPIFDTQKQGSVPITNRLTATGYELLEMSGLYNAYVLSIITVGRDGDGSVTIGHIAHNATWRTRNLKRIDGIIRECA